MHDSHVTSNRIDPAGRRSDTLLQMKSHIQVCHQPVLHRGRTSVLLLYMFTMYSTCTHCNMQCYYTMYIITNNYAMFIQHNLIRRLSEINYHRETCVQSAHPTIPIGLYMQIYTSMYILCNTIVLHLIYHTCT